MRPLATRLLARALEAMADLEARMAQDLLKQPDALDALQNELEDLGWAIAMISAMGEQQPELARHHPQGHRVLLGLLGLAAPMPDLAPAPGGRLAWALADVAHSLGTCSSIAFNACAPNWHINFGFAQPVHANAIPDWPLENSPQAKWESDQYQLQIPGNWLIWG